MQLTQYRYLGRRTGTFAYFYIKYFNGKSNEKYVNRRKACLLFRHFRGEGLHLKSCSDGITKETADVFIGLALLPFLPDRKRRWMP